MNLDERVELTFWGRKFSLPVKYDCYKGETVTAAQRAALANFVAHPARIERARKQVEAYCGARAGLNLTESDIFSFVRPRCVFVKRDAEAPRIALMCDCRCDPEHGIAVVFPRDGPVIVGNQDIIL